MTDREILGKYMLCSLSGEKEQPIINLIPITCSTDINLIRHSARKGHNTQNKVKNLNNGNTLQSDKISYTHEIDHPFCWPFSDFNTSCPISQPRVQKKECVGRK